MSWASRSNTLRHSRVVLSRTVLLWLQVQVRKTEQQLHQKEDMGEVLHVVDFDQLKIENQQYLDRIEERNTELLRLKATTGKAVQVRITACCQTPSNTC